MKWDAIHGCMPLSYCTFRLWILTPWPRIKVGEVIFHMYSSIFGATKGAIAETRGGRVKWRLSRWLRSQYSAWNNFLPIYSQFWIIQPNMDVWCAYRILFTVLLLLLCTATTTTLYNLINVQMKFQETMTVCILYIKTTFHCEIGILVNAGFLHVAAQWRIYQN